MATIFENRMVAGRLPEGVGNHGLVVGLLGATVVAAPPAPRRLRRPDGRTRACYRSNKREPRERGSPHHSTEGQLIERSVSRDDRILAEVESVVQAGPDHVHPLAIVEGAGKRETRNKSSGYELVAFGAEIHV